LGLGLLVALIYMGVTFSRPYYRYYQLSSHTGDFLKTDIGEISIIRKHVLDDAAELGVPLTDANLFVTFDKDKKSVTVKGTWTDSVDLFGYYRKDVDFVMEETY
ncbi:MAG TPA: hypothetical protein VEP69_05190, partial [Thermodesulfovibrionales bacterium]|nr:hypothetical protein [Thermodesulfovibrionales bacterium]